MKTKRNIFRLFLLLLLAILFLVVLAEYNRYHYACLQEAEDYLRSHPTILYNY